MVALLKRFTKIHFLFKKRKAHGYKIMEERSETGRISEKLTLEGKNYPHPALYIITFLVTNDATMQSR